jgi:hypothetical protein
LNKYTVDFNRLYNFLAEEKKFKLGNLLSFFSKSNETHPLRLQEPDFRLLSAPTKHVESPEERETFNKLLKLFDVEEKMEIEESFRSFKTEVKELNADLKALARVPLEAVSKLLNSRSQLTKMGEVPTSELFVFEVKPILKGNELLVYYVEREERLDRLVEYNCHKRTKRSLTSTRSHILSLAVADRVIAVLEDKFTTQKIVAEIVNEEMNGGEIETGRRISRAEG